MNKTIGKTFLIVLAIWLISVLLIGPVQGRDCDHTSDSFERFENMRLLPPVKILDANPVTRVIKYKVETKMEVRYGEFVLDADTKFEGHIWSDYKGLWWVLYCRRDNHVYTLVKVNPEQIKDAKRKTAGR